MYCLHQYLGFLETEGLVNSVQQFLNTIFLRRKAFEGTTIPQLQVCSSMYLAWPSVDTWLGGGSGNGLDMLPGIRRKPASAFLRCRIKLPLRISQQGVHLLSLMNSPTSA